MKGIEWLIARRCLPLAISLQFPSYRDSRKALSDVDLPFSRSPATDHLFLNQKAKVGIKAVDDFVENGMVLGIGSGSTVGFSLKRLLEKIKSGELKGIKIVPCSQQAETFCAHNGIATSSLSDCVEVGENLDLIIDGADEIDVNMNLVKGSHGSMVREKLMENMASRVVIVCDDSKLVRSVGMRVPIPVEIIPFEAQFIIKQIESLPSMKTANVRGVIRKGSRGTYVTDGEKPARSENNLLIVDFYGNKPLQDPAAAAADLESTAGVVAHGLFCGQATTIMVATGTPSDPVRIVGDAAPAHPDTAEAPWWADKINMPRRSLERERVDNREPPSPSSSSSATGAAASGSSSSSS